MTFPFGEPATQHTAGEPTRDADGNDVATYIDVEHTGVAVYPRESAELVQGQATNIIGLTLLFKPAITATPQDQFTVRGERWDVDAMPGQYQNPLTATTVTRIDLTRATG